MYPAQERCTLVVPVGSMVVHHGAIELASLLGVPRSQYVGVVDHGDRDDLVIRDLDAGQTASGTLSGPTSERPPMPMMVSRHVAVFRTAFWTFLQRWRILVGWASGSTDGPAFAAACPRRNAETSVVEISLTLGAALNMDISEERSTVT